MLPKNSLLKAGNNETLATLAAWKTDTGICIESSEALLNCMKVNAKNRES